MRELLRVGLIDDHPAISTGVPAGLSRLIDPAPVFTDAKTVDELVSSEAGADGFDVVILDIRLADESTPEDNVRRLSERGWPVLLYTREPRPAVLARCFAAGARGAVGKHEDWPVLAEALHAVGAGELYYNAEWACAVEAMSDSHRFPELAPRELEAVQLYAAGIPAKSVARRMGVSETTVKEYLRRAGKKYENAGRPAATKTGLAQRAMEDGYYFPVKE